MKPIVIVLSKNDKILKLVKIVSIELLKHFIFLLAMIAFGAPFYFYMKFLGY